MKINILHLADLHCNSGDTLYLNKISVALCKDFDELLAIDAKPDLICITGDLVDRAQEGREAYNLVESIFLKPIRESLSITNDYIFLCPGNHDVDRTQVSEPYEIGLKQSIGDQNSFRKFAAATQKGGPDQAMLKGKFAHYLDFSNLCKNTNNSYHSIFYDAYELKFGQITIGVISLNSAWRSSQFGDDEKRLILGESTVMEAAAKVSHCDLKLCLCHHPFEMLADWDVKPVQQTVAKHFHALLNGHVHDSDVAATRQLFGNLFISTVGCLKIGEPFSSYTLIQIDLEKDSINCMFRKWYNERGQFDQETAKAASGKIEFKGIRTLPESVRTELQINVVRGKLQELNRETDVVSPIEGIEDVVLDEVFIEPLLFNKSAYDRDTESRETLNLDELLKTSKNLFLAGRPEFGKSTILKYSMGFILRHDRNFESKIPVMLKFNELPKINIKLTLRLIARILNQSEVEVEYYANHGQLILLVDDFNDRQDAGHEKRVATMREFYRTYPKCRYIFTVVDFLAQPLQLELLALASDFQSKISYIGSLNTARIRQLLLKWKAKHDFDVDTMLHQMLYYFQHCQIPVTPLAVTLFLGVLFRKKKERNIRNEAFLIENYLETILEKINPNEKDADTDFRDKEDFLAAVAWEMAQRRKYDMESMDFEKLKINHFEKRDEDLPHRSFFEAFFLKGILSRDEGYICFRRRFWFYFFLAKALEWNKEMEIEFLRREDVLKFSKALSYRAGLSRKEVGLLSWVDERAMKEMQPFIDKYSMNELNDDSKNAPLSLLSDTISNEVKQKNTDEHIDKRRDDLFLDYEEDKGNIDEEQIEHYDLITLQSEIIRNTTQIGLTEKRRFIDNNLSCYMALMWGGLEIFREMLQKMDEAELFKLFFKGRKDTTMQKRLQVVIEQAQRIVQFVVPLSVLVYMNEHVGSPKLCKSFRKLAETSQSPTRRLFYHVLVFAQKPKEGLKNLRGMITPTSSLTEDFIICGFLRWFCYENKVEEDAIDKIVAILDEVRLKYAKRVKGDAPYLRDTFRSDVKKSLQSKHVS